VLVLQYCLPLPPPRTFDCSIREGNLANWEFAVNIKGMRGAV
jgi:hypothetical protein